ncbi:hypothetical protein ACFE04_007793 [Oxalis oulophora]
MVETSSSTRMHIKLKKQKPRIQITQNTIPIIQSDPQIKCKPTISSLLLLSKNPSSSSSSSKKNNNFITQNTFKAFGCTAASSQQVSVPAVIRSGAVWEEEEEEKKKKKIKKLNVNKKKIKKKVVAGVNGNGNGGEMEGCLVGPADVWCGPGIGLSSDAIGSVDCVVARRNLPERPKIDNSTNNINIKINSKRDKDRERELRSSFPARRTVNPENLSFWESDSLPMHSEQPDSFGGRYYRHNRYSSPDGFGEIVMFQNSLLMGGGRSDLNDRFRNLRLDVDNMTYEELLELGDKIGHVSTGLKEDEIIRCLRKIKPSILHNLPPHIPVLVDKKCTICQFEYEEDDEMGKLDCGHGFHLQCIKPWLERKNTCPICKSAAVARS